MGRVGYDRLQGILRVTASGDKQLDQFTVDVLTYHAALELEMDQFISLSLPRANRLAAGKLGYTHKIAVLSASWKGDDEAGDKLARALVCYNSLRNSVAHNDRPKEVKGHLLNLQEATIALDGDEDGEATPYSLAIRICSFMGDEPEPSHTFRFLTQRDEKDLAHLSKALETTKVRSKK